MRIVRRIIAVPLVIVIAAAWIAAIPIAVPLGLVVWIFTGDHFENTALWGAVLLCSILDWCNE